MKVISIKADAEMANKMSEMASRLHISRSELVRRAFRDFCENYNETYLKEQVQAASFKVRKNQEPILDTTLLDGLEGK